MKRDNYHKAQKLMEIRLQIDEVARRIYQTDDNHYGSCCTPQFASEDLQAAHLAMSDAIDSIEKELDKL